MLRTIDKPSAALQQLARSKVQVPVETMNTAQTWLTTFDEIITANQLTWLNPLVNISPLDEIVLEWWNGKKKLIIYIEADRTEYIQVWGTSIDNEMTDGDASESSTIEYLWRWLFNTPPNTPQSSPPATENRSPHSA
jgi:hypothetical protein